MIWDWRLKMISTTDICRVLPKKRERPFQKRDYYPVWSSTLSNFCGEQINKGTKQRYEKIKWINKIKKIIEEILYCVTQMHILVQTNSYIPRQNNVKMIILCLWDNFHHYIHCKYLGKTVSCSNCTQLFYVKANKGYVLL